MAADKKRGGGGGGGKGEGKGRPKGRRELEDAVINPIASQEAGKKNRRGPPVPGRKELKRRRGRR